MCNFLSINQSYGDVNIVYEGLHSWLLSGDGFCILLHLQLHMAQYELRVYIFGFGSSEESVNKPHCFMTFEMVKKTFSMYIKLKVKNFFKHYQSIWLH